MHFVAAGDSQLFTFDQDWDGTYTIRVKAGESGQCLDSGKDASGNLELGGLAKVG